MDVLLWAMGLETLMHEYRWVLWLTIGEAADKDFRIAILRDLCVGECRGWAFRIDKDEMFIFDSSQNQNKYNQDYSGEFEECPELQMINSRL